MNKYRIKGVGVCVLAMLAMVGCGRVKVPDVVDVTSIAIADDGAVTSYLVEVFDKEYYDISELTSMAINEAAEYNTEHQTGETIPVTVDKVATLEDGSGKIVLIHKYDSVDTFMDYNDSILFYGTVNDAVNEGYALDAVLRNVKDSTLFSEEQLLQESERYILITNTKAKIYCPEKVTHVSDGAVYEADGSVDTSQTDETVVILMKK